MFSCGESNTSLVSSADNSALNILWWTGLDKKLCPALVIMDIRCLCFPGIATFLSLLPSFSEKCEMMVACYAGEIHVT